MQRLRAVRGMAASVSFLFLIFSSLSHAAGALSPAASANAAAALTDAQLKEIDDYLDDYYRGVVITRRTLNDQSEDISCVDVLHQPGSRHSPQIQFEPSDQLKALLGWHVTQPLPSLICPTGSVEMRLPTREQIIAKGGLRRFLKKDTGDVSRPTAPPPVTPSLTAHDAFLVNGHYWATVNQESTSAIGSQGTFTLWRPAVPLQSDPSQFILFSDSQMWIGGGGDSGGSGVRQSIESGTHVYQYIYKDVESHFFIFWTADNYTALMCQDLRCPAFVVTSGVLPIGGKIGYGSLSRPFESTIAWYRDPATGNWILFAYDPVNGYRQSGYYPGILFNGGQLSQYATRLSFGGEVFSPVSVLPTLPMGTGNNPITFVGTLAGNVAYQRGLKYMDLSGAIKDFVSATPYMTPANGCAYGTRFFPAQRPYAAGWGSSVFYGGKGVGPGCGL